MNRETQDKSLDEFIASGYRSILKREPDPPGLLHHREAIQSGARAREQFLLDMVQSDESLAQFKGSRITTDMTSDTAFQQIYERCRPFTMTSLERMYALYQAVNYVQDAGVEGDIVECGVWKGGSSMLAAQTLMARNDMTGSIYLFDTFAGMSQPSVEDSRSDGADAKAIWKDTAGESDQSTWCYCSLTDVQNNMLGTGYPPNKLTFIQGRVEDTIPCSTPSKIAILRLDTDWYESTLHEMKYLFPLISEGGVLILDDFGWWTGAGKAVEEYLADAGDPILLCRICGSGARMGIKRAGPRPATLNR